jgi:hypothetical protein
LGALKNTGFLVAQQHFFDNSASRFTAKRRLVRLRKGFTGGPAFGLIYRKNLEFALRTLFTTFSEISNWEKLGIDVRWVIKKDRKQKRQEPLLTPALKILTDCFPLPL